MDIPGSVCGAAEYGEGVGFVGSSLWSDSTDSSTEVSSGLCFLKTEPVSLIKYFFFLIRFLKIFSL